MRFIVSSVMTCLRGFYLHIFADAFSCEAEKTPPLRRLDGSRAMHALDACLRLRAPRERINAKFSRCANHAVRKAQGLV